VPEETIRNYLFDCPGLYQIRIVGELDERWLTHLEGLEISTTSWGHYRRVTQISGRLADQTVLSGLLDLLTDLGRVILTVERIEMDEEIEETQR
jgi:hypothetical protein